MKSQEQERELARIKALRGKHSRLTGDAPPHNHTIREIIDAAYLIESVQTDLTESIEEGHTHDGSDSAKVDWGDIDSRPSVFPPDTHSHQTSEVTSLQEYIEDTTGAMVAGNTETGIAITYDDSSGKLNAAVAYGTGANTACQGNDARLSDARTPLEHEHELADITDYVEPEQGIRPSDLFGVGKDGYVIDHWELTENKGAASGYASLDSSSLVVQNPANAQTTAAASKIPISNASGKIDDAWIEPAGSTTHIQFNDAGALAGDANLVWDNTAKTLTVKASASVTSTETEKLTNTSFASDLSGWTAGAGWAWETGGYARHTAGNTEALSQDISVTSGNVYRVWIKNSSRTAGSFIVSIGSTNIYWYSFPFFGYQLAGNHDISSGYIATSTGTITVSITPTTDFDGRIDSLSILEITPVSNNGIVANDADGNALCNIYGRGSQYSLYVGSGGHYGRSQATYNLGVGSLSLEKTTVGTQLTAVGYKTLQNASASWSIVAIGDYAAQSVTNSYGGIAIGGSSAYNTKTAQAWTAIGSSAGYTNTTGSYWTAIGRSALRLSATADGSTAIGYQAGYSITGANHTAIGTEAGYGVTSGSAGIYIGYRAGYSSFPTGYSATSSNMLIISNSNTTTPLIFGDFGTGLVHIHNDLKVNTKFGLGLTPIARKAHVVDPSGGGTVDAEARTAINAILATLEDFGFHATS